MTIAILCPGEQFSSRWVRNFTELYAHVLKAGFAVMTAFEFCSCVFTTRNSLAAHVREAGLEFDYVLWIDDDNVLDAEGFERLRFALDSHPEAAMVAAWSWCETDQFQYGAMISAGQLTDRGTCVPFTPDEFVAPLKSGEPIECGYTGFPAVLMRGSLLRQLGPNPFAPIVSDVFSWGYSGEDYAFCQRVRAAGLKVFVLPALQVPHLKLRPIVPTKLLQFEPKSKECAA